MSARQPREVVLWCIKALAHKSDDCLYWPFARNKDGHGVLGGESSKRLIRAHLWICERVHGPRPDGTWCGATCGNLKRGCVNPAHLKWMTPAEVAAMRPAPKPRRILNADEARELFETCRSDTMKNLAAKFGVAARYISGVRAGRYLVGGVKGFTGMRAGDPRWQLRPNARSRTPITILGAPAIMRITEFEWLEAFIPSNLPVHIRDDIRNDMILALYEGGLSVKDEIIRTRGAAFRRSFYQMNYERSGFGTVDISDVHYI